MKDKQKRLKSIQSQLMEIYQDLFGLPYADQGKIDEGTQFQTIIERFKQKNFYIRQMQKERQKKEKKGKKDNNVSQQLQINEKIRLQIKNCQSLLSQATQRIKNNIKKQQKNKSDKIKKARQILLNQCYQMFTNVKNVQFGDTYQPKKSHQTLEQFKKKTNNNLPLNDQINFEQQQAMQRINKKDENVEALITQLRNVDQEVKKQLRTANDAIDITKQLIQKNITKVDRVNTKVRKGTSDLVEVLKHYRRPNKLCLDVILVLLVLSLIGVIINMLKK